MSVPNDISYWVKDAHLQLTEAQLVCNEANKYITSTLEKLATREDKLPRLIYYLDSTRQQLRLLGIVKDSLDLILNEILDKKTTLKNRINLDMEKLSHSIKLLKSTKIDKSFNRPELTLFEFISEVELNNLFNEINNNLKETDELIKNNRTDALLIRLHSDLDNLNKEFNILDNQFFDSKFDDLNNVDDPVNKLLSINNELEVDMVSILESFNNHYDQCLKGDLIMRNPQIDISEKKQLIDILENDVIELPHVLEFLNNDCEIIIKNCKEITNIIKSFEVFYDKIETFLKDMQKYGELRLTNQLDEFISINSNLNAKLSKSEEYKHSITQYIHDFNSFLVAYYSLILELDRRSTLNNKINNMIDKFQLSLSTLIDDDFSKRIDFLNTNGDFLPQNLIDLNIINKEIPKIDINFQAEELPSLSDECVAQAKKFMNNYHTNQFR
ncbi:hypothetical protein CANARDRAFT_29764 [[Candida] arabinofermentans NRRL YB-2248]|uniref:Autophagy-related protein 17 n=1 Tax=[Candida] arabinofermentans NRRL YB-2248 TaxID=983967 RepID=A0A1E4SWD4_9ASCO|nr:hypothetical protein CANARDRAFT_29764 [[Candida] arabinofermentans NRRL YB-2248]